MVCACLDSKAGKKGRDCKKMPAVAKGFGWKLQEEVVYWDKIRFMILKGLDVTPSTSD